LTKDLGDKRGEIENRETLTERKIEKKQLDQSGKQKQ